MPKFLTRIVAILLIPCLVAEHIYAFEPPPDIKIRSINFESQALEERSAFGRNLIASSKEGLAKLLSKTRVVQAPPIFTDVKGYAVYPGSGNDVGTLARVFQIFPGLEGAALVDGAYQYHEYLFGLILQLSAWGKLSSFDPLMQELIRESRRPPNRWSGNRKLPIKGPQTILIHRENQPTLRIVIFANDYIPSEASGNDRPGPLLSPGEMKEHMPEGFSVPIVCFPGYWGHMTEKNEGKALYDRVARETGPSAILYVSKASPPPSSFKKSGQLQLIYKSGRFKLEPSGLREDFALYRIKGSRPDSRSRQRGRIRGSVKDIALMIGGITLLAGSILMIPRFEMPFLESWRVLNKIPWSQSIGGIVWMGFLGTLTVLAFSLWHWARAQHGERFDGPGSQPKNVLVMTGPYRYVRHPVYLSYLILSTAFIGLIAPYIPAMLLFAFRPWLKDSLEEEKMLKNKFGSEFISYAAKTPRFIPHIKVQTNAIHPDNKIRPESLDPKKISRGAESNELRFLGKTLGTYPNYHSEIFSMLNKDGDAAKSAGPTYREEILQFIERRVDYFERRTGKAVRLLISYDPHLIASETEMVEYFDEKVGVQMIVINGAWYDEKKEMLRSAYPLERHVGTWLFTIALAHALDHEPWDGTVQKWKSDERRVLKNEKHRLHKLLWGQKYPSEEHFTDFGRKIRLVFETRKREGRPLKAVRSGWRYGPDGFFARAIREGDHVLTDVVNTLQSDLPVTALPIAPDDNSTPKEGGQESREVAHTARILSVLQDLAKSDILVLLRLRTPQTHAMGYSFREIQKLLKMNQLDLSQSLNKLREKGLLNSATSARRFYFYPNKQGYNVIDFIRQQLQKHRKDKARQAA